MKVEHIYYKSISPKNENLSLILGYFDGVHLGHLKLIENARKNAKNKLGIITFDRPISSLIVNGKTPEVLTSLDDRFRIISRLGIDYYFLFHIDKDFLNLSEIDFINILKKLNVKEVFVGEDFRFGNNRKGDINLLKDYFDVNVTSLMMIDNEKVSSQNIKELLSRGEVTKANKLLSHNYQISGVVIPGNHIGTKIGFPTLNIKLNDNYLLPRFGVYKTIAYINNIPRLSITNVGVKPTVDALNIPVVEVHLKDYENEKIDNVSIEFLEFIRDEKKFSSLEELKKQIEEDTRKVFKK